MHGMTLLATHSNLISDCCRSFNFIKRLQLQDICRPFRLASSTSASLPDTSPLLDLVIVMSSPSAAEKWEQLKNEGNVFFAQGNQDPPINHGSNNSAGAYTKYSEAIVLSPQTATLYSNRAASLIKMGKLDLAYNDAVKATEIDPKWGKGYSRIAEVYVAQCRYSEAMAEYTKAINLVDARQKAVYQSQRDKLAQKLQAATLESLETSTLSESSISEKWFIKKMEADIRNPKTYKSTYPCPLGYLTAADKVYTAYLDWKEGMEILGKTKPVSGGTWIEGRITELMTCSASLDERGFHMDNLQENWTKINIHIQAEQAHTGAYGPLMKVAEMMDGFKKRLAKEGWNKVRPAMSVTVRGAILIGFLGMVIGRPGDACAQLRRGLLIAEAIDREFPLSATLSHETRGNTFMPSLIRSFYVLLGKAMIMGRGMTKSESAFPVEEMKTIADKILKSLRDNPILLPPPVAIPGMPAPVQDGFKFHCHFGAYHYAEAYMLLGYYHQRKADMEATDFGPGSRQKNAEHLRLSSDMYARAASFFPDDDPQKQAALWCVIENSLLHGGSTVGQLRSLVNSVQLEKSDKYKIFDTPFHQKSSILDILAKAEKVNPTGAENIILKPLRSVTVDPEEGEEAFLQRMMETDISEADIQDESNWAKVYSIYVQAKNEGRIDELQLEVS